MVALIAQAGTNASLFCMVMWASAENAYYLRSTDSGLLITDGVFSMDGDVALCRSYLKFGYQT